MTSQVAVCIPTYCEADNIADVLRRVRAAVPAAHILVGDDSSPDGTADLANDVARELGQIEVIVNQEKLGLGGAYRRLHAKAVERGFDVVVQLDADLSHDPAEIAPMVARIEAGADLVIGTRYIAGGSTPDWPRKRRILSRGGNLYAAAVLALHLHDVTSGFRAFRASTLVGIDVGTTRASGYGFQIECAYRADRRGYVVEEHPITFRDRFRGESKLNLNVAVEELLLVTGWGVRDLLRRVRRVGR